MKQMDEELTTRIKAVFDDYDDGLSENGWTELRKKYPEKADRKLPIWWISGIAAAILVAFGLFLTLNSAHQLQKNQSQIAQVKPQVITDGQQAGTAQNNGVGTHQSNQPVIGTQENLVAAGNVKEQSTKRKDEKQAVKAAGDKLKVESQHSIMAAMDKNSTLVASNQDPLLKTETTNDVQQMAIVPNKPITVQTPITVTTAAPVQQIDASQQQFSATTESTVKDPKKTTAEFLKEQSLLLAKEKPKKPTPNNNIANTSIDVFTGTFVNYMNDDSKVNMGLGLNANVKLTKHVSVSVGAGISQNKIDYQPNSRSIGMSDMNVATLAYTNSVSTDVKVAAQLLNFDIPVVFKFYPGETQKIYFAAGVNSNTYLSQKYVYNVTMMSPSANSLGLKDQTTTQETEKIKLKGFDFANSAIFAIGINQRLDKTNSIIFEPYFKPVLGTMGQNNLKINTVGLNLKFNFTTKK